jgi:hypothetical protein
MITELESGGGGPIYDVEFHPHEFLLAGGSHDRTVKFWDLEKFSLIGAEGGEGAMTPATGPVRCIYFHPEGECLFSGTVDGLRVHGWEPSRTFDSLGLGWGRLADLATASNQLIGASFAQCHVALYVVDLKRVQPFCGVNIPEKEPKESGVVPAGGGGGAGIASTAGGGGSEADPHRNVTFRPGQTVRRSFVREKPGGVNADGRNGKSQQQLALPPQVKISEETSDKSGTEGEDSDAVSHADIPDIGHYETIFRPRNRELNRTPPADEPFEAPAEMELPMRAAEPTTVAGKLVSKQQKMVSPSPPTRRASQPAMYSAAAAGLSGYPVHSGNGSRRGSTTGLHPDVMRPQEVHLRSVPHSGALSSSSSQRPYSVYGGETEAARGSAGRSASHSVPRELGPQHPGSPVRAAYRTAISLGSPEQEEYLPDCPGPFPPVPAVPYAGSPASPSRHHPSSPLKAYPIYSSSSPFAASGGGPPLDRPTAVRPQRASEGGSSYYYHQRGGPQQQSEEPSGEDQTLIPTMVDRPCGLNSSDFLPQKFGGLKIGLQAGRGLQHSPHHQGGGNGGQGGGGGSGNANGFGFEWPPTQLSESEVTSAILRDHMNIQAVLRARHRNLEVIRQLWQTKDAKTAVEQVY